MSKRKIMQIMDFLENTGEDQLRLLGGEPTLHPEFMDIVNTALARNFHVHLFSNCMMPKKVADFLADLPDEKLSVLVNVSPQAKDTQNQKKMVFNALERLGPKATAGITLTSPDFEYSFLIDLINRFKLRRRIRVGVAQPIVGGSNEYLKPEHYRETGNQIVKMALECAEQDILIGFDCGLTLCMFSEAEIGVLSKNSEGFKIMCQPIIDIGPELDVWHCFPLAEILNTRLDMFKTRNHIVRFYDKRLAPYRSFGCRPECKECIHLERGICNGGCLAHAINSFNRTPPKYVQSV